MNVDGAGRNADTNPAAVITLFRTNAMREVGQVKEEARVRRE